MPTARNNTYPKAATLGGNGTFTKIMDARVRETAGPLVFHAVPGTTANSRLGISIGRRVGNAVARNKIKRMIREAFRLSRSGWPAAYDLVVIIRPHEVMTLEQYSKRLNGAVERLHTKWANKPRATE